MSAPASNPPPTPIGSRSTPGPGRVDQQFIDGALAIVRGLRFLWRTPAARALALVPIAVCAGLSVLAIAGAIHYVPRLMAAQWPDLASSLGAFGEAALRVTAIIVACILGLLVAWFATPPLSAPALERLVLLRERELGIAARPAAGFWREFWSALAAQLVALAFGTPVLALLWIVTWLAPPAALVTVPLKFLVLAMLVAWSLLDYPLSLRGVAWRDRVGLMRSGAARVLGFGSVIAFAFTLPFLPLLLLPAAVAAAAEVGVQLELAHNPRA